MPGFPELIKRDVVSATRRAAPSCSATYITMHSNQSARDAVAHWFRHACPEPVGIAHLLHADATRTVLGMRARTEILASKSTSPCEPSSWSRQQLPRLQCLVSWSLDGGTGLCPSGEQYCAGQVGRDYLEPDTRSSSTNSLVIPVHACYPALPIVQQQLQQSVVFRALDSDSRIAWCDQSPKFIELLRFEVPLHKHRNLETAVRLAAASLDPFCFFLTGASKTCNANAFS